MLQTQAKLLLSALLILGLLGRAVPARSATIELAQRSDGTPIVGVTIEGEIIPDDADKLLAMYNYYGDEAVSQVFLLSHGGNVDEAMKIGRLVRTLRLETIAPDRFELPAPSSIVLAKSKSDVVCASACFLIYAAGVKRSGNFLVLHRSCFPKDIATNLTDDEQEVAERQLINRVSDYLREMDIDQFYIDKMMSTNSQDGYAITESDTVVHPLEIIDPPIEEIVLTKCTVLTPQERQLFEATSAATPEGQRIREGLIAKMEAADKCENDQLDSLRDASWDREHASIVQDVCKYAGNPFADFLTLETFMEHVAQAFPRAEANGARDNG